jgi:hypothetical protein
VRRLYLDNDAVHKLAALDLLPEAISVLVGDGDIYVLATFPYWWKGRIKKKKVPQVVVDRVATLLTRAKPLTEAPDSSYEQVLGVVPGIDGGEASLYSLAAVDGAVLLTTGDKTSVKALQGSVECSEVAERLRSRVAIVEQVIGKIMDKYGFDHVIAKVVACKVNDIPDTALRSVFGSGAQCREQSCREALAHYIADVRGSHDLLMQ